MTTETAQRYPLSWPAGWKRTTFRRQAMFSKRTRPSDQASAYRRKDRLGVGDGLDRLENELRRLGARNVVISSNLRRNLDGSITANQAKMLADPGIAVYFRLNNQPRVLACDRWDSAADNMAAIAGHIEALRTQDRYGVGTLDQAFAGYAALPPTAEDWAIVLGVATTATRDEILSAHRRLAAEHHPDKGGRSEDMARINEARDIALKAVLR